MAARSALARFPLAKSIAKCFPGHLKRRNTRKPDIVSEELCDHTLQRLSPFLLRNRPLDILDLWPGAGLWSSKLNRLLQPRNHVLLEPELELFRPLLDPLAQSHPSYKLLSMDIFPINDWKTVLTEHFPEQGPDNCSHTGVLPQNDTLLVLANMPSTTSDKDHFTAGRWLQMFMETCMQQTGLHSYGSVRLLATLPSNEAQAVLPRYVVDRRRVALWTENVALHAFEVAAPPDEKFWVNHKGFNVATKNAARVAERTAEMNISTPPGREVAPLLPAPESPDPGRKPVPYTPRIRTALHDRFWDDIQALEKIPRSSPEYADAKKKRNRAQTRLNRDNRQSYFLQQMVDQSREIDAQYDALSRAAADPNTDSSELEPILDKITALRTAITDETQENYHDHLRQFPHIYDSYRASLRGYGNFDDALLAWDRRPFEPLQIQPGEFYPQGIDRTIIYFEANPNSPAIQKIHTLAPSERSDAMRLFENLTLSLGRGREALSAAEVFQLIFPGRCTNDIVKSIPSLAEYATKTPKPDFDTLPKTVHGEGDAPDPTISFQENLDYDLSDVRVHILSTSTIWDICIEYQRSGVPLSSVQLNRVFGGTLTSYKMGVHREPGKKRLH
ncbi:S-adenosyl-L-methionine-dependent methyltransferase [Aspergillus sclerotioniger CBS 115572]|uniref:S-adenosyl-L-methionine-dependent methyltransferase n=1 Tax=Aspergillus sclerotioniger CBS 115572 TaxID=1450535 RepID=A0A317V993_9EURO|nr:S-adenosyl-L-methionine-dependent methyltransferase [Aspergillus sclerotioniger CBS 115572]PWY68570.1 S-adenosyl-L-methionine-dependent methyltransferase [Aspergillus sclerotioniger CBS 115572]